MSMGGRRAGTAVERMDSADATYRKVLILVISSVAESQAAFRAKRASAERGLLP